MKQDRLNTYLLMHCHKSITDPLETVKIACVIKQFKAKGILENLGRGMRMAEWKINPSTHVSKRSTASN